MCVATRFPEAIPLGKITASSISKALQGFSLCLVSPEWHQLTKGQTLSPVCFLRGVSPILSLEAQEQAGEILN